MKMSFVEYNELAGKITNSPEFKKLSNIGGHKIYHLEGDALTHTMMVVRNAHYYFKDDYMMILVALLHDIGKIYTSVCNGENDWTYPNHAKAGAENLDKFIPADSPYFGQVQWYISNHIKPLFWRGKTDDENYKYTPYNGCSYKNLVKLAICDIKGSKSVEPQTDLLNYLYKKVDELK